MGGYHEAYAITQVNEEAVVTQDGQYLVFCSMGVAAHNLGVLAKANPNKRFTIRPFRMRLPWTKGGF